MSMATLKREIVAEARMVLENQKLRKKDLLEWSSGKVKAEKGEVALYLRKMGVNICVLEACDKRKKK